MALGAGPGRAATQGRQEPHSPGCLVTWSLPHFLLYDPHPLLAFFLLILQSDLCKPGYRWLFWTLGRGCQGQG